MIQRSAKSKGPSHLNRYIILTTVGAAVTCFFVILQQQNAQYKKQRTESSRLVAELSMASSIQSDMLPNIFPAFPERDEFGIFAAMAPAKEVGGAFLMVSKNVLQQYTMQGLSPKAALEAANRTICTNNREELFVTV